MTTTTENNLQTVENEWEIVSIRAEAGQEASEFASDGHTDFPLHLCSSRTEHVSTVSSEKEVTASQVSLYRKAFDGDPSAQVAQNAVCNTDVSAVALDRLVVQNTDFTFSIKLDDMWKVKNQKSSGRCWLFSTLNLFRVSAMKIMKLGDFEFSQAHIFFWDKVEKSNNFMEAIIDTSDRPIDDRTIHFLLSTPISDGGQWGMAMNLIRKHGLVPKSVYPESFSSSSSRVMDNVLEGILRSSAQEIRSILDGGGSKEEARKHKESRMEDIWRILCVHLGTPPEQFNWQWRDKDNNFHRRGTVTPLDFAKEYVDIEWESYVTLVNDPRNEYYKTYTVDFLQNVVGGEKVIYLNVPSKEMKSIAQKMMEGGKPVWFGCDVAKEMDSQQGLWDAQLYRLAELYGVKSFGMDKGDRLRFGQTMMTHAMLFTGVDVEDGKARKWRVENSWGEKVGDDGYYTMNDNWFDEYVFEIAAPRQYLTEKMIAGLNTEPLILPAWDPMGSLAREEAHHSRTST